MRLREFKTGLATLAIASLAICITELAAKGSESPKPTAGQLSELNQQIEAGKITGAKLESFLAANRYDKNVWIPFDAGQSNVNIKITCDALTAIRMGLPTIPDFPDNTMYQPEPCVDQRFVFVKLFRFTAKVTTDEILANMKVTGYRPANVLELLALSAHHARPFVDDIAVVALGSKCGFRSCCNGCVAVLYDDKSIRRLYDRVPLNWDDNFAFLAVHEKFIPPTKKH